MNRRTEKYTHSKLAARLGAAALATALAGVIPTACSDTDEPEAVTIKTPADVARAKYQNYSILTRRGNDPATIAITSMEPLDLSDPVAVQVQMLDEIDRNQWVIPYVAGSSESAPYMWLQAHPVERALTRDSEVGHEYRERVIYNLNEYSYQDAWTFRMQVTTSEGRFFEYTSFVFAHPDTPGALDTLVDIIDPVAFGIGKVPAVLPAFHNNVGDSDSGQWNGCEVGKEVTMTQLNVEHWDRGTCNAGLGSYDCFDRGWCSTQAKARITCDTSDPECPRMVSSTVQSGSCDTYSGGTENCLVLYCVTGQSQADMSAKADTQISGDCSIHTNIELLVVGTPVNWEISYSTPESPVGSATVKFTGTTPTHSKYQVFQQTMCCMPLDAGVPDASTPDSGTPDSGTMDAGIPDSGTPDSGTMDAGVPDSGTMDAGTMDAGTMDAYGYRQTRSI